VSVYFVLVFVLVKRVRARESLYGVSY
jgi:hypothetical protein